jgi:hypothetical protein
LIQATLRSFGNFRRPGMAPLVIASLLKSMQAWLGSIALSNELVYHYIFAS